MSKEFNPDYLMPPREDARFPILKTQADDHWQEFRPKLCSALKKWGKLDHSLDLAVESTILILHRCERAGLSQGQARGLAMREILLPPL